MYFVFFSKTKGIAEKFSFESLDKKKKNNKSLDNLKCFDFNFVLLIIFFLFVLLIKQTYFRKYVQGWSLDPNCRMIRLSRPKQSLIRFSRRKLSLIRLCRPKLPLIRHSRQRRSPIRLFRRSHSDQTLFRPWSRIKFRLMPRA